MTRSWAEDVVKISLHRVYFKFQGLVAFTFECCVAVSCMRFFTKQVMPMQIHVVLCYKQVLRITAFMSANQLTWGRYVHS